MNNPPDDEHRLSDAGALMLLDTWAENDATVGVQAALAQVREAIAARDALAVAAQEFRDSVVSQRRQGECCAALDAALASIKPLDAAETKSMHDARTRRAVQHIIESIRDRRGLKHAWLEIDDYTREEIVKEWRTIVLAEINPWRARR